MKPDDRSITDEERNFVVERATRLIHKADAWGIVPVPIDNLIAAAKLRVAPRNIFDPSFLADYAKEKGAQALNLAKRAIGKIFGILDTADGVIHIDESATEGKQNFLKLHEVGHHEIPHQKKSFLFFEDSKEELDPDISDLFEKEANNFASFLMFSGDGLKLRAADMPTCFNSIKTLSRKFKASLYASMREYVRTHSHSCFVLALELPEDDVNAPLSAQVRRIEISQSFLTQFGELNISAISVTDYLGRLVPFGRRVTRPTSFTMTDLNGDQKRFVGEALNTTYNILIFGCLEKNFQKPI